LEGKISKTSTVVAAKDQVWCELVGEAVILDMKSGVYYGLNPVGARVWSLIQEPRTIGAVLETLLEEYDVEPGCCEAELFALIEDLAGRGLVEMKAAGDGAVE